MERRGRPCLRSLGWRHVGVASADALHHACDLPLYGLVTALAKNVQRRSRRSSLGVLCHRLTVLRIFSCRTDADEDIKKAHGFDMRFWIFETATVSGCRIHMIAHGRCRFGDLRLRASSRGRFGCFVAVVIAISVDLGWPDCLRRRRAGAWHIRNAGNHDVDPLGEGILLFDSFAACLSRDGGYLCGNFTKSEHFFARSSHLSSRRCCPLGRVRDWNEDGSAQASLIYRI